MAYCITCDEVFDENCKYCSIRHECHTIRLEPLNEDSGEEWHEHYERKEDNKDVNR